MSEDLYEKNIPERLKKMWQKFKPHEAIMTSRWCDFENEKYLGFSVDDPTNKETDEVAFWVYEDRVKVIHIFTMGDDEKFREDHTMTHKNCLAYLAQLPRGWYTFTTDEPDD